MAPFEVRLSPTLQQQVRDVLKDLDIQVTVIKPEGSDQPVSLLTSHVLDDFNPSVPTQVSVN